MTKLSVQLRCSVHLWQPMATSWLYIAGIVLFKERTAVEPLSPIYLIRNRLRCCSKRASTTHAVHLLNLRKDRLQVQLVSKPTSSPEYTRVVYTHHQALAQHVFAPVRQLKSSAAIAQRPPFIFRCPLSPYQSSEQRGGEFQHPLSWLHRLSFVRLCRARSSDLQAP
eukprot:Blabericola_migrator_1__2068@NODE_1569_length_4261_cov_130_190987_g1025_i0_p2_GENE_NODE_1569_length_4261_cov_130_190987_g1025_i0NODE_1569_length_4261_cov_130_190987_g1025_i0_p2_ORF_typecomplete_len167_score8_15_NODE_1569_length_4261_cov_130_190987_g1025_i029623462